MACGPPQKTQLAERTRAAAAFAVLAVALCAAVQAVSDTQAELAEVRRSTPDLDHGAQLFDTCGACHGPDGGGTRDGQVPRIGGQHTSVLWKQLVDYRHDRRWDLRMEHFADRHHLGDAQAIADVAAYIHQLEPNGPAGEGSGKLTDAGGALYAQLCRSCHGAIAQGDAARVVPRIASQHYEYLRRQFYDAVDGPRSSSCSLASTMTTSRRSPTIFRGCPGARRRRKRARAAGFTDFRLGDARYSAGSRTMKQAPFGVLAR